jgi:hypothetical protein
MPVLIFQILYLLVFLAMGLMSIFVIYHIVFYSYTNISKIIMLAIFVPVTGVLLLTNFAIFQQIQLQEIFSMLLP